MEYAAEDLGANYIATGHYVRRRGADNQAELLRGLDSNKDQSYFLYRLKPFQLERAIFPLGGLENLKSAALPPNSICRTAAKKDSTGICFIGERPFREFLQKYLPTNNGKMVTPEAKPSANTSG